MTVLTELELEILRNYVSRLKKLDSIISLSIRGHNSDRDFLSINDDTLTPRVRRVIADSIIAVVEMNEVVLTQPKKLS